MPYIGELRIFAGSFAPYGWAFCDGQLLSIAQHSTLFTLLGTTYGGNGQTTFALPDLRGRVPVHAGIQAGIQYIPGMVMGRENEFITANQLPSHTHVISGNVYQPVLGENPGQLTSPDNANMAITNGQQAYSTAKHATNRMAPLKVSIQLQNTGSGQPLNNMQPYLPINFVICLTGDFPPHP
ncbi:phage tail protein [Chitinophaga varians]|uniref:phage tail protein n=1 Tax=Chitinophaga varians TaxID=2202339 RepID=UPI00165F81CC|nr:tail fiber protein [Chitinophaga varians]MBC9909478.1 phage tail protein [Chitinophaga varians]